METIGCIFCEGASSEPVISENGYTGRQCSSCGLILVSPRPTREEIEQLYLGDGAYLPAESFLRTSRSLVTRLAARHVVRILRRETGGGRLLEIGPGGGNVLVEARRHGFEPFGVELNPTQAEFIRETHGIPCVQSLDEIPQLGVTEFDVVYHRDVLSHLYDPVEEFGRLNGLLAPGGWHVFETGNLGDVDHRQFDYVKTFQYPDHLFFYSTKSLEHLLGRTGFELRRLYRYSLVPGAWQAKQLRRLAGLVASARTGSGTAPAAAERATGTAPPRTSRSTLGNVARTALDLSAFGSRLTIGAMRRNPRELQTLVVVARKTGAPA